MTIWPWSRLRSPKVKTNSKLDFRPKPGKLFPAPAKMKKPLIPHGLKSGAREEGRTPDLMLGKRKSTGENEKNFYKSTPAFLALPYFSPEK